MSKTAVARIVIVEDENITALDIRKRLQGLGYQVLATASSGEEALAKVAEFTPDLVLMDIVLKGLMDGVQAAGMIRSKYNIPVVYLTAFSDNDTLQRAKVTEPFGYVLKPFEERDLHSTIEMALYKHHMEKRLCESERFAHGILDADPECVKLVASDGTLLHMNRSGLNMIAVGSEAEVFGKSVYPLIVKEDQEKYREFNERVCAGQSGLLEFRMMDLKGRRHHMETNAVPIQYGEDGKTVQLGVTRDITERKRLEEDLRRSIERQGLLLGSMPMAFYTASPTGKMETTWMSDQAGAITGFSPKQFVESTTFWSERLHPEDRVRAVGEYESIHQKGSIANEYRWMCADGTYRWFLDLGVLVRGNDGKTSEITGAWLDISERKKTEQALDESQVRLTKLNECMLSFGTDAVENINRLVALCGEQLGATAALYNRVEGENLFSVACWNTPSDYNRLDKAEGHVCYDVIRRNQHDVCLIRNLHESSYAATDPNVRRYGLKTYIGKAVFFANVSIGSLCVVHQTDHVPSAEELKLLGIVASAIGIEEKRKRAEEELRQSENQYRLLFMENPYPIWVYDRETLKFLGVNEAAIRHFGFSRDEFLTMALNDLRPGHGAETSTKNVQTGEAKFDDAGIWKHRKKDGSIALVEATSRTTKLLGKEAAIVVMNDITSRKQSEEKITMFGHAIGSIGEAVSITDLGNRILFVNDAFLKVYGYTEREVVGKSISIVRPPNATPPDLPTVLARTLQGGWHGELTNQRKDGTEFPVNLSTSVVYDGKGHPIALVGVAQDISQQKQFEQQVRQSQKMESMGTMVGGISHDFNNILNNILGFVYQLRKYSNDPEKIAKYTDTIEKSATRGAELANQLLSIVRKRKRDDEQVNINALIDEVASLMRETFPKNIALKTTLPSQPHTTLGNHGELYQAILNLCLNARDAMPDGGTLAVEVAEVVVQGEIQSAVVASSFAHGQECVKIQVQDTGTGIAKPVLDKIFDPFFTTKDRGKGTGLGLSVVYSIVKNHKGVIAVDTEEGHGSTFSVYLPTVEACKEEKEAEEVAASPVTTQGLVLLVDDEASMLELGKELLEDQGYSVLVAHDGMEAVQMYRERWKEVALVVLDLLMPKLDGGQAFLQMKKINPNIKAFFCTGYSSDQVISSLLSEEHLSALQKPFKPMEFMKMVRSVLSM